MKKILVLLPLILIACTKPETPAQSVFLAESDYAVALRAELAYSKLPRCGASSPKLCSDVTVVRKVQKADDIAWTAIQEAQTAVRTPGFTEDKITMAAASAKALTAAFVDITNQLRSTP